jgi:UDP-glucose 4-epimerase
MRYIVTGGAGFIGSNLAERLARDHEIVILDDFSAGRLENIEGFLHTRGITCVKGSITDPGLLRTVFEGADGIFHQAAIASGPRSVADPAGSHAVNLTGTLNVLAAARDEGVRQVVLASSAAIYGNNPVMPKHEGMAPEPLSPYAVQKLGCEHYARVFSDLYGLRTASLRYFNVYGPRQDPNSEYAAVIPKFITRLLDGRPPVIYGDGEQTRDFIFVGDVARANIMAMESGADGVYNIAGGERISLNELVRVLMKSCGMNAAPVYERERPGDVRDSVADVARAREAFGFSAACTLEDGLNETISWFRSVAFPSS